MRAVLIVGVVLLLSACAGGQPTTSVSGEIGVGTSGGTGSGTVGIRRGNVGVAIGR